MEGISLSQREKKRTRFEDAEKIKKLDIIGSIVFVFPCFNIPKEPGVTWQLSRGSAVMMMRTVSVEGVEMKLN